MSKVNISTANLNMVTARFNNIPAYADGDIRLAGLPDSGYRLLPANNQPKTERADRMLSKMRGGVCPRGIEKDEHGKCALCRNIA